MQIHDALEGAARAQIEAAVADARKQLEALNEESSPLEGDIRKRFGTVLLPNLTDASTTPWPIDDVEKALAEMGTDSEGRLTRLKVEVVG
jgi:hypothetical protein